MKADQLVGMCDVICVCLYVCVRARLDSFD